MFAAVNLPKNQGMGRDTYKDSVVLSTGGSIWKAVYTFTLMRNIF